MKQQIITVNTADAKTFEEKCNELLEKGYYLKSSSCGEQACFEGSWMAVFGNFPDGE